MTPFLIGKIKKHSALLVGFVVTAIWSTPLWLTPGKRGVADWDFVLHRAEAVRKTIVEYHQWPGHNPWANGGLPLLGNPSVFPISIKGVFSLLFGSYWGLQFSALCFLLIGFYGAWKLGSLWWSKTTPRILFAFLLIGNPAMILHGSLGHMAFLNFYYMPLFIFFILTMEKDPWSGLKAAAVFSLAFLEVPVYIVQYGGLIGGAVFLWHWLSERAPRTPFAARWISLFLSFTLCLIFFRLVTTWEMVKEFPRVSTFQAHFSLKEIFNIFFIPHLMDVPLANIQWCCNSVESACYLGILPFLFFLMSFRQGFRWWHMATIMILWAAIGNDRYWYPMYWIQKLPSFSSHLCFARIRIFAYIFFAIGIVTGFQIALQWSKTLATPAWKFTLYLLGILSIGEIGWVDFRVMQSSHRLHAPQQKTQNPDGQFRQISHLSYPETAYDALQSNLGWLDGYGESNFPGTKLYGGDHPKYPGEFSQQGHPVQPAYWSPNHIRLEGLNPTLPLTVNMNPGSPWHINGAPAFPNMRIVEMDQPFHVQPNPQGVVDLTYHHPGQLIGLCGTLIFGLLTGLIVWKFRTA